jgi:uncharacterized SAM-binding protein YcdF (DUF218 family)
MAFYLSKIAALLIDPVNLILLLMSIGVLALWFRRRRLGAWLVSIAFVLAVVPTVVPVGPWLLRTLEDRFPPSSLSPPPTGIIVLGGSMQPGLEADRDAIAVNGNIERLLVFAELARQFPDARLVFTGGTGSLLEPDLREADAAARFLDRLGIDPSRVLFERKSRNTFENAVFTRQAVRPGPGDRWLLVTSARHMPRAVGAFRQAGWRVDPFPVDYRTRRTLNPWRNLNFSARLGALRAALREWAGLVFYHATGRSSALFPAPTPNGAK